MIDGTFIPTQRRSGKADRRISARPVRTHDNAVNRMVLYAMPGAAAVVGRMLATEQPEQPSDVFRPHLADTRSMTLKCTSEPATCDCCAHAQWVASRHSIASRAISTKDTL
ncbi:hypothetical protein [Streptomyces sp. NPDC048521]|uniref:hypothetical protein n=1 Tax=Streptomyces sp. NPDC048521 TaxID=3365566 RepID=UPI0037159B02